MGRSYLFECARCGFNTKVSGGTDHGLYCSIQTILCRDCRKLYDAVTRLKVPAEMERGPASAAQRIRIRRLSDSPPTLDAAVNRILASETKRYRWIAYRLRCPISAVHKVQSWHQPGKCPRCGTYLDRSALPFRMWD